MSLNKLAGLSVLATVIIVVGGIWAYRTIWVEEPAMLQNILGGGIIPNQAALMTASGGGAPDFRFLDHMKPKQLIDLGYASERWYEDGKLIGPAGARITYHSINNGLGYRIDFAQLPKWVCHDIFVPGWNISEKIELNGEQVKGFSQYQAHCISGNNTISVFGP